MDANFVSVGINYGIVTWTITPTGADGVVAQRLEYNLCIEASRDSMTQQLTQKVRINYCYDRLTQVASRPDDVLQYDASSTEMTIIAKSDLEGPSIFANTDPTGCPINTCVLVEPAECSGFPA